MAARSGARDFRGARGGARCGWRYSGGGHQECGGGGGGGAGAGRSGGDRPFEKIITF